MFSILNYIINFCTNLKLLKMNVVMKIVRTLLYVNLFLILGYLKRNEVIFFVYL